jgi:hypothetical protein
MYFHYCNMEHDNTAMLYCCCPENVCLLLLLGSGWPWNMGDESERGKPLQLPHLVQAVQHAIGLSDAFPSTTRLGQPSQQISNRYKTFWSLLQVSVCLQLKDSLFILFLFPEELDASKSFSTASVV